MVDVTAELNEDQAAAVAHGEGPLLVIAGAGSGKTRVITHRIANLVLAHAVPPRRILAVTFTNKAAREMKQRVEILLGRDADCWVSTFHSSCARLLRRYGERFDVDPRFTIYDDQDQKAMVARVIKEIDVDHRRFPPRLLQNEINKAKRELVSPAEYSRGDFYRQCVQEVYALYERRMAEASALDFGDLLYRVVRGMRSDPELAAEIGGLFDHVLVDEFQDTNRVQLELVRLLTAGHGNVCVVGDDDQSIYSWRGADVTNILEFERYFPGAHAVTLERNYRSSANILSAAHGVVSRLSGRRDKRLWTDRPGGERIFLLQAPDEREEARLICRAIRELRDDGFPLSQQAIFYRTNAQSRVFEEVLRAMDVPHRVVGGMRFYERAEVKDLIAYLRLVQNPADHAALTRVINTPARGIGKSTVQRLVALAAGRGSSAYDAIPHAASGGIGAAGVRKLTAFREMVESWRAEIEQGPSHLAQRILEDVGYLERLEEKDTAEADARLENVCELAGSIEDFESEAEQPTLDAFLELVALQTDVDTADFDGEEVTLMTVHSAKGLEFDAVYVTGLEDGLFPYRPAGSGLLEIDREEMDEERRLCYVAMTRARRRLFLSRASSRRLFGGNRCDPPSRFLADLPPEISEDLSPERPRVEPLGTSGRRSYPKSTPSAARTSVSSPAGGVSAGVWVDRSFDQSTEIGLAPGAAVRHPRFGSGTVLAILPGARAKAEVRFPAYGRKTILVDYLEPG
ncbi:MAG: UvrD-helicase domain-containing protein [Polyangia bacterium]